jgi:hypothetical protein
MKGLNTYSFNHGTAEEAFQEYINKRATASAQVAVTGVMYDTGKGVFKVTVKPAGDEKAS